MLLFDLKNLVLVDGGGGVGDVSRPVCAASNRRLDLSIIVIVRVDKKKSRLKMND